MIFGQPPKSHKVDLTDYDSEKDVKNRLFLAGLSSFDVEVLQEVVYNSLTFPLQSIVEYLNASEEPLSRSLAKFTEAGLCKVDNGTVHVNKDMRRYFELHTNKFDEDFVPDIDYLQELLSLIPIHILPAWYAIPRTSNNIFESIIEKYFRSPRNYERYLSELEFDEKILMEIKNSLFHAEDCTIFVQDILNEYQISHEKLERLILLLEYHFVGVLSYRRCDNGWQEVITPIFEWHQFLRYKNQTKPVVIEDVSSIQRCHPHDFGFVQDLTKVVRAAQQGPITITSIETAKEYIDDLLSCPEPESYLDCVREMVDLLDLCKNEEEEMKVSYAAPRWLSSPIQEQAATIYRINRHNSICSDKFSERNLREMEKGLRKVMYQGWIYADQFLEHTTIPIGTIDSVTLVRKGRKWKYEIPQYGEIENQLAINVLKRLFQSGMVATGRHNGRWCFRVTPYGRMTLDD